FGSGEGHHLIHHSREELPPRNSCFFSSRRQHTRWPRDWSSDVCSSDLRILGGIVLEIGILNQRKIAGGLLDGTAHRCALATIHFVAEQADSRLCRGEALQNIVC